MSRRERIVDVFDRLADSLDLFTRRAGGDGREEWLERASGKIIKELCSYAGALDRVDLTPDQIRRIGEVAGETLPAAFRSFGQSLAAYLFWERDPRAGSK